LGISNKSIVAVPTMTFTATAEVLKYLGAKIVLIDSEPESPNIDLAKLEKLANQISGVIPVHFAGIPVDIAKIRDFTGHDFLIVEDAAHAFPSKIHGQFVGTLDSDATVFSFYANKTITTGEGGMVVCRNEESNARMRIMRSHGIDRDAMDRFSGNRKNIWEYDVVAAGYKYNLTDMAAALGLVQLSRAKFLHEERDRIAQVYSSNFQSMPFQVTPSTSHSKGSSMHLYTIEIDSGYRKSRDQIIEELRDLGVMTSVHYKPLHLLTYWRKELDLSGTDFPNATSRFERTISLPLFPGMTEPEIERVVKSVKKVIN
jgi:dTDP-4-amino-4,6-dideoxygalactose transaminase